MAKGGIGKSFVSWRESYNPGGTHWNSDSILLKHFPGGGYSQLYVSFYVKFSKNWTKGGMSKLFRAYS
tara:strand:- start:586 stop:789 length:204 start_codon:yes stop_codon:yes gene_type:complete